MDPSTIISTVISNFTSLLPLQFSIIHIYEQGVKYRFGSPVYRCHHNTGMRFYYPHFRFDGWIPKLTIRRTKRTGVHPVWIWFETIETMEISECVVETPYQTISLKNGDEITVSLSVAYRVRNVEKATVNVNNIEDSILNMCQGCVPEIISNCTKADLAKKSEFYSEKILQNIRGSVYNWGVRVDSVKFIDMTKSRSFRLFGDGNTVNNGDEE